MDHTDIPFAECATGTEGEMLLFALDRVHRQFAWKTGGLPVEQMLQKHPPSELTLAWLVQHLTRVEADWTARAQGRDGDETLADVDWDALAHEPDELRALWFQTIARTRQAWTVMATDLDTVVPWYGDDYHVNRRRVLVDILEENLLHTGQTSIVREAVDGLTGNDPP
ncbi:mycothiol transferase [Tenggerimyces flavus]|uniref:DUF664 domain-containing protein n=1 Tax=Tenggerimyces flavus TaxID=1708749 RepID=A0ABV7Y7P4_9ACTN|nr:DUF664 domain-containing protein [Tenggerimyces flavus]MBM7785094.1 putative damage-inducible protein DinB [Tenggerimyces flavus]